MAKGRHLKKPLKSCPNCNGLVKKKSFIKKKSLVASFWIPFFLLCIAAALLVLMASLSLNEDTQFEPNDLIVALIVIFFIAANGFFIRQLILLTVSIDKYTNVTRGFFRACLAGLINIFLFSVIYYIYGIDDGHSIIYNDIQTSLYFSIATWTITIYGDLQPVTNLRFITSLEAIIGYLYMAILVGLFLNLMKGSTKK